MTLVSRPLKVGLLMTNKLEVYLHQSSGGLPERVSLSHIADFKERYIYLYAGGASRPKFMKVEEMLNTEGEYIVYYHNALGRPSREADGILTIRLLPPLPDGTTALVALFNSRQSSEPPQFVSFINFTRDVSSGEVQDFQEVTSFDTPALPYQGGVAFSPKRVNMAACYSWNISDANVASGSPIVDLFDSNFSRVDQFTFENSPALTALNLSYSPDGRYLGVGVAGDYNGNPATLALFDVSKNRLELVDVIYTGGAGRKCGFHPTEPTVAVAHNPTIIFDSSGAFVGFAGASLSICGISNRQLGLKSQVVLEDGSTNSAQFSPDGKRLISATFTTNKIHLFSYANGHLEILSELVFTDYPWEARWHPAGKYVAVVQRGNPQLSILSTEGDELSVVTTRSLGSRGMGVAFSEDGLTVFASVRSSGDRIFAFAFDPDTGNISTSADASYRGPAGSVHTTSIDVVT